MNRGTFVQTKQGLSASYEMYKEGKRFATAEIPKDIVNTDLFFYGSLNKKYVLRRISISDLKRKNIDVYRSWVPYAIFSETEEICGYIYNKKTRGVFKGYVYEQIQFLGREYVVYTISIPKEGTKYAIYRFEGAEHQVALIEKPEIVYNRLDEYFWMALYEEDIEVIGLYLLYIDFMMNSVHRLETVTESKEVSRGKTLNKDLLKKYNEGFKSL